MVGVRWALRAYLVDGQAVAICADAVHGCGMKDSIEKY